MLLVIDGSWRHGAEKGLLLLQWREQYPNYFFSFFSFFSARC
jgi:hypothetical protein